MNRSDLLALAKKAANKRTRSSAREAIKTALREHFASEAGRQELEDAPRITYTDRGETKQLSMTAEAAIEALADEAELLLGGT